MRDHAIVTAVLLAVTFVFGAIALKGKSYGAFEFFGGIAGVCLLVAVVTIVKMAVMVV
jgi:hypothetical protein